MRSHRTAVALLIVAVCASCVGENEAAPAGAPVVKGGDDRTGNYEVVANWWKAAPNHDSIWSWGLVAGVAVDNPDRVLAVTWGDRNGTEAPFALGKRHTNLIVAADRNGNITEQWTQWDTLITRAHQIYVSPYDPDRSVWVVDNGGAEGRHQILKFSNDGARLLMRIGSETWPKTREEARANKDPGPDEFGWPSTLAFLPNGDFLLADGYWNGRVVKFNAAGEYLMEWGHVGSGPGEFDLMHGTAVDRDGRVYIGDRTNNRIQVFSSNGDFIEEWPNVHDPVGVWIDQSGAVWVVSASHNRILKYTRDGEFLYGWGVFGPYAGNFPGGLSRPHQIDVDQDGALYVANYEGGWVNKFVPRQNADAGKIVGRQLRLD